VLEIASISLPSDEYKSLALLRTTVKGLLQLMLGEVQRMHGPDEIIGFEVSGGEAVFMGDYKLPRIRAPFGDGSWRLINLRDDPTESRDLSAVDPQRLKKMMAEVEAGHQRAGVVLPAWLIVLGAPLMLWWWLRSWSRSGVAGAGRSA